VGQRVEAAGQAAGGLGCLCENLNVGKMKRFSGWDAALYQLGKKMDVFRLLVEWGITMLQLAETKCGTAPKIMQTCAGDWLAEVK